MSQSPSYRLRPIAAFHAVRNLMRNREDTHQVFLLIDALRGKTTLRQFARFRQTETGRAVLSEHRRLLDRLSDRPTLAALPAGSLGRAYYDFMASENLSAEGLVEASRITMQALPADDVTLFRERSREMHDLLHVVTGYGRDPLGEACLVAFSYAQTGLKGFAVIAVDTDRHRAQRRRWFRRRNRADSDSVRRSEIAVGLRLGAQLLNSIGNVVWLRQKSFTQLLRPVELIIHHRQDLRNCC